MAMLFGFVWVKPSSPTLISVMGGAVPVTVMLDGYGADSPAIAIGESRVIGASLL